jgi:colanic acid biosynthesis glycosyl transferase WcaI
VRNNIDGIVVPPRDSRALANAILELLNKPDKAKLFGEEGCRKVIKHFDLNKSVHEFENILEEIISIPGKNSR